MYHASSNLWQFAGMNIAPIRKEILKGSRELTTQKKIFMFHSTLHIGYSHPSEPSSPLAQILKTLLL